MRQRSPGLTWLDRNDHKQQMWAHKYLQREGRIDQRHHSSTSDQLLRVGETLESTPEGILTIGKMRNAWRRVKCNSSDKGRKTYAFKLTIDVKKELAWLARRNKVDAADMLGRLISAEQDAYVRFEDKLNEAKKTHKELLSNSRNNTAHYRQTNGALKELLKFTVAMLCRSEVLLHDALSAVTITKDQEHKIEKMRKRIQAEADADITAIANAAARAGAVDEMEPHTPGRLYKAMKEEKRANRLEQESPTDLQPVTYSKSQNQQSPEAKAKPNSVTMVSSANQLTNRPNSENLKAQPNKNASPHVETDTSPHPPRATTQIPPGGYRVYVTTGIDGVVNSFTKKHPAKARTDQS